MSGSSGRSLLRVQALSAAASPNISQINTAAPPTGLTVPHTPRNSQPGSMDSSIEDTPLGCSSHGSDSGYLKVEAQRHALDAELYDHHIDGGDDYLDAAIGTSVPTADIDSFLSTSTLYSTADKRWSHIPQKAKREDELYAPFFDIIESILEHFGRTSHRRVYNCSKRYLKHEEGVDPVAQLKSAPDLVIHGHGIHFIKGDSFPVNPTDYVQCATPLDVKTERNAQFWADLIQIAVYVRQCFIQQHNRRYVRSAIFTEKSIRLYHFDRSGCIYSSKVDIHEDARLFVSTILQLSSMDAQALGYDTSIYWEGDKRLLRTLDAAGEVVKYTICKGKPKFLRRAIRGRGTCCWKVRDADGNLLLVKEGWRSKNRIAEVEFLKAAKGLRGVGQMIAFEEGENVSDLRGSSDSNLRDRTWSRITLEAYGKPIHEFISREQLLVAFRDAVAGHEHLWNASILHRDVSINNILFGSTGAEEGNRGVIIDLDLAIWVNRTSSLAGADFRTGTRAFQSIKVLSSGETEAPLAHDYLDDLESFFDVLLWLCCGYEGPSRKIAPQPALFAGWESLDSGTAAGRKSLLFYSPLHFPTASPYFGPVFQTLIEKIRVFLFNRHPKARLPPGTPRKTLQDLIPQAKLDYAEVLQYIDDAVESLKAEHTSLAEDEFWCPSPDSAPVKTPAKGPSQPPTNRVLRSQKRASSSQDQPEGSPASKKQKSHPYAPRTSSTLSESLVADDSP